MAARFTSSAFVTALRGVVVPRRRAPPRPPAPAPSKLVVPLPTVPLRAERVELVELRLRVYLAVGSLAWRSQERGMLEETVASELELNPPNLEVDEGVVMTTAAPPAILPRLAEALLL